MRNKRTITKKIHFRQGRGSRKVMETGEAPNVDAPAPIPRISRLLALAIQMQGYVARGEVTDYADLARLAHVTRARITQLMNLLLLASDIQEEILFMIVDSPAITERSLRPITAIPDWSRQRAAWKKMRREFPAGNTKLQPDPGHGHAPCPPESGAALSPLVPWAPAP